jgi:hypothetical protein
MQKNPIPGKGRDFRGTTLVSLQATTLHLFNGNKPELYSLHGANPKVSSGSEKSQSASIKARSQWPLFPEKSCRS